MKKGLLLPLLLLALALAYASAGDVESTETDHVDKQEMNEFLDKYNIDLEGAKRRGEMERVLGLVNVLTKKLNAEMRKVNARGAAAEGKVTRALRAYKAAVAALRRKHNHVRRSGSALENAITQHRVYMAALKEAQSQLTQTKKVAGYDLDAINSDKHMLKEAINLVNDVLGFGGKSNLLEEDVSDVEEASEMTAEAAMEKVVVVLRNKDVKQAVAIRSMCQRMLKNLSSRRAGVFKSIESARALVRSFKGKVTAANRIIRKHKRAAAKIRAQHSRQQKAVAKLKGRLVKAQAFAKMTRRIVAKDKSVLLRELRMLRMLRSLIHQHQRS